MTKTVAAYLAAASADKRAALLKIRKTIKAAAPKATERVTRLVTKMIEARIAEIEAAGT